jgi:Beta-lactamase enzyme family
VPSSTAARTALILGACLFVAAGAAVALAAGLSSPAGAPTAGHAPATAVVSPATPAGQPARSGRPARPGPSPSPEGVATPAPRPDPFPASAAAYLAGRAGVASAAVYDVITHQLWTIGPARPQAEASVVKVDILETLLARDGTGGVLPGADGALALSMIEDSDNAAATDLWDAAGGAGGIRSFNAAAGLTDTAPSPCVQCAGFPWPGWGLTTTTPADQITLLRQIAQPGGLLTGTQRRYAAALMENVTPSQRWGVSGGVPPQATVALKNGWLPLNEAGTDWQINSVGWVSGLGRDYLMAVLTTGNPDEQYGIDTIGWLSAAVWQHLG